MGMLALHRRALTAFVAGLIGILAIGLAASTAGAGKADQLTKVDGTIWAANRGSHTIRGFDAATGSVVSTVAMRDGSQPGDLAYARGKLYVAEEFGTPPAIAIVDPDTGVVEKRIELAPGSRPHHVHRTARGDLVAFGLYGTDNVAVVDTERSRCSAHGTPIRAARAAGTTPASSRETGRPCMWRATRRTR